MLPPEGANASYRHLFVAWVRSTVINDPMMHTRIVTALDRELADKGLRWVESPASAGVLIAYHASIDRALQITAFSSRCGHDDRAPQSMAVLLAALAAGAMAMGCGELRLGSPSPGV